MTITELNAREAEIRANDIADANAEYTRENAINKLMLSGMSLQDAQNEFNDQVAYFMRGIDGYDLQGATEAAADVLINGVEMSDYDFEMVDLMYN